MAACAVVAPSIQPLLKALSFQEKSRPANDWRPTEGAARAGFAGSAPCTPCHARLAASHQATGMAKALRSADNCQVLATHPTLTFRNGEYSYQIVRQSGRSLYTVSYRDESVSTPISYCFGHGETGQTYLIQHNGAFYESRVSFYPAIERLDFTVGAPRSEPESLENALGQRLTTTEAQGCFACHATNAVSETQQLQLEGLTPGIGCEACHGPAAEHVAAAKAGQSPKSGIFSPTNMAGDELSQRFCGSCHRSFEEVMSMPGRGGLGNVRFQPYRLAKSACYYDDPKDRRISCIACHDPHQDIVREPNFYDAKCLACHASRASANLPAGATAKLCRTSTKNCSTCHMPKTEPPGSHYRFTDHFIRIVRRDTLYQQ
jgi:Cytochrome c554 and c-prime